MVKLISSVVPLAIATGVFGSAITPRAVARPSWAQTKHFIDLGGAATTSHVGNRQMAAALWKGQIFPNGPNTTIRGPTLAAIHDHLVELNPELLKQPAPTKKLSARREHREECGFGPYSPYDCVSHCTSGFISSLYSQNTVHTLRAERFRNSRNCGIG
jgi:hypothetical protein